MVRWVEKKERINRQEMTPNGNDPPQRVNGFQSCKDGHFGLGLRNSEALTESGETLSAITPRMAGRIPPVRGVMAERLRHSQSGRFTTSHPSVAISESAVFPQARASGQTPAGQSQRVWLRQGCLLMPTPFPLMAQWTPLQ